MKGKLVLAYTAGARTAVVWPLLNKLVYRVNNDVPNAMLTGSLPRYQVQREYRDIAVIRRGTKPYTFAPSLLS